MHSSIFAWHGRIKRRLTIPSGTKETTIKRKTPLQVCPRSGGTRRNKPSPQDRVFSLVGKPWLRNPRTNQHIRHCHDVNLDTLPAPQRTGFTATACRLGVVHGLSLRVDYRWYMGPFCVPMDAGLSVRNGCAAG